MTQINWILPCFFSVSVRLCVIHLFVWTDVRLFDCSFLPEPNLQLHCRKGDDFDCKRQVWTDAKLRWERQMWSCGSHLRQIYVYIYIYGYSGRRISGWSSTGDEIWQDVMSENEWNSHCEVELRLTSLAADVADARALRAGFYELWWVIETLPVPGWCVWC